MLSCFVRATAIITMLSSACVFSSSSFGSSAPLSEREVVYSLETLGDFVGDLLELPLVLKVSYSKPVVTVASQFVVTGLVFQPTSSSFHLLFRFYHSHVLLLLDSQSPLAFPLPPHFPVNHPTFNFFARPDVFVSPLALARNGERGSGFGGSDGGFPVLVWVLGSCGFVLLSLGLVFAVRRLRAARPAKQPLAEASAAVAAAAAKTETELAPAQPAAAPAAAAATPADKRSRLEEGVREDEGERSFGEEAAAPRVAESEPGPGSLADEEKLRDLLQLLYYKQRVQSSYRGG